jgi:hypothetical protein
MSFMNFVWAIIFLDVCQIANALTEHRAESTWAYIYGPPSDCKEKAKVEETSLRKCIRPLVELSAPGHDELRAYLSLLVARSLSANSSSRFPDTPL